MGGCAAVMGQQVTKGFFEGLKEAGANLLPGIWGSGDSEDAKSKKAKHGQEGGHSQESDHGLSDLGVDSETSVSLTQHAVSPEIWPPVMPHCDLLHRCLLDA